MNTTKHTPVLPEICAECGSVDLHLKTNCGQVVAAQCQDCRYYWSLDTAFPIRIANAAPELLEPLKEYVREFPAFRSKPCGSPNSDARREQEQDIKREDAALAAIAKAEGR